VRQIEELMVRLIAIETSKIDKILRHLGIADDAPGVKR
jgi:hypothetical protein